MGLTKQKPAMCDTAGQPCATMAGIGKRKSLSTRQPNPNRNRIMLTRIRRSIADIRSALSPFASAVDRRVVGTLMTFFGR
jgi:hypothetical protein